MPCEGYVELPGGGVGAEFLDEVEERVGEPSSCLLSGESRFLLSCLLELFGERLREEESETVVLLDDGEYGTPRDGEEGGVLERRESCLVVLVGEEGAEAVELARTCYLGYLLFVRCCRDGCLKETVESVEDVVRAVSCIIGVLPFLERQSGRGGEERVTLLWREGVEGLSSPRYGVRVVIGGGCHGVFCCADMWVAPDVAFFCRFGVTGSLRLAL